MTRDQLIRSLVDKQRHITYKDMSIVVKDIIDCMVYALSNSGRIEVRGFGSFERKIRNPRLARNPRSGEQVMTDIKCSVRFKPGKVLKERVDAAHKDDGNA